MSRRNAYVSILVVAAALLLDLTVIAPSIPFLGLALGLPLVLVLPGYALLAAIFPDRLPDLPQRLLFAVGLSIAVTILGGYLLNLTPWGLRAETWLALLSGVSLAGLVVAARRRRGYPVRAGGLSGASRLNLSGRQWLLLGLVALNVAGAIVVARVGAEKAPETRFTQLWILQGGASGARVAHVGVSNQEQTALQYRLIVDVDATRMAEWPSLTLQRGEKWETDVTLPATEPVTGTVYATLYRQDEPGSIYRQVTLKEGEP